MGERTQCAPGTFSDIQMARIAIVADPQGAIFALYDGTMQP